MLKRTRTFAFLLIVLITYGCSGSKISVDKKSASAPVRYSIIYVIHGDANYLYHDADGHSLQADEHVLKTAKRVAKQAKHGVVFIFHQRPEKKILWLFPKKDRHFLYYRNGNLQGKKKYSPHSDATSFASETRLYHKYTSVSKSNRRKIFLYFGHEVPVRPDYPYHYSRPDVPFDTSIFTKGVGSFIKPDQSPFNLTVLSTCNNGTPTMVKALSPYTHYLLASPQNLHLSHIDSGQLASLLEQPQTSTKQIADSLASHTFKRLSSYLQTAVTLSIYNTDKVSSYLPDLARSYRQYLKTKSPKELLDDNRDCRQLPFFNPVAKQGVETWYKPAQFGHKKHVSQQYSGWGCK